MVDYNLLSELDLAEEDLDAAYGEEGENVLASLSSDFSTGQILTGTVTRIDGGDVYLNVHLKSEGIIKRDEFDNFSEVEVGDELQVMLESLEDETGRPLLSKKKADRALTWERIVANSKEGDTVRGRVTRKIKGGLLVNIGVPVFLPASQVDIRRPGDIGEFIDRDIEAVITRIDAERRNIVVSRRRLIEVTRRAAKEKLLKDLIPGQVRRGTVKNIADFGAFVDLGGIDGLLHITDMSWDRVSHPSELLKLEQEIDVVILSVDPQTEKIALGLKQIQPDPWAQVELKYPVGSRIRGEAVNIVNYGAFVKLETGVEGLVHISEMSWTRRINHPSEVVAVGDQLDVVVLEIDREKREISLGIKQTEVNPWSTVGKRYPAGTVIEGKVRNLANYGAFIEIEEGIDGLLHVSDMSWTKKISHPSEMFKKGDTVSCVVLSVDEEKQRIALGYKQLVEDPWIKAIPTHYQPGMIVRGKVTKITNFGVFVELEPGLEGLLHISELADHKVENPQEVVQLGEEVEVKILRVDTDERKIGLSRKRASVVDMHVSADGSAEPAKPRKPRKERRGGLGDGGGDLISFGSTGAEGSDAEGSDEGDNDNN